MPLPYDHLNPRIIPLQTVTRVPHARGDVPHARGDVPHARGDVPHAGGDVDCYVLTGVVLGVISALSVGGSVERYRCYGDALGWLDNWARPDGPLQHEMFSAAGIRALHQNGASLWDELHYRDPAAHMNAAHMNAEPGRR